MMIPGNEYYFRWWQHLKAGHQELNMREKIYNQPMRRLQASYKEKARDTEVFGKISKGILTQLKGLTVDFEQKSV